MAEIRQFEDLIAWQKARELCAAIYRVTAEGTFSRDFALRDQIRRAAISVMSNIAEGFERGKASEFHQFLCIAKGSCAELRSQLFTGFDVKHLCQVEFEQLMKLAIETGKVIGGLRLSVQRRRDTQS